MAYKVIDSGQASEPGIVVNVGDLACGEFKDIVHDPVPFEDQMFTVVGTTPTITESDLDILRGMPHVTNVIPEGFQLYWKFEAYDNETAVGTFTDATLTPITSLPTSRIQGGCFIDMGVTGGGLITANLPTWTGTIGTQVNSGVWIGPGWAVDTPYYTALTKIDPSPFPIQGHALTGRDLTFGDHFLYEVALDRDHGLWRVHIYDPTGSLLLANGSAADGPGPVLVQVKNQGTSEVFGTVVLSPGMTDTGLTNYIINPNRWVGVDTSTASLDENNTSSGKSDPGLPDAPLSDWAFYWISETYRDVPLYWYLSYDFGTSLWTFRISDNTSGSGPFLVNWEKSSSEGYSPDGGFTITFTAVGGSYIEGAVKVASGLGPGGHTWDWDSNRWIRHNSGVNPVFSNGTAWQLDLATDSVGHDIVATIYLVDPSVGGNLYNGAKHIAAHVQLNDPPSEIAWDPGEYVTFGPPGIGTGAAIIMVSEGNPIPTTGLVNSISGILMVDLGSGGDPWNPPANPIDLVFMNLAIEGMLPTSHWYTGYWELSLLNRVVDPNHPTWLFEIVTPQRWVNGSVRNDGSGDPLSEARFVVSIDEGATWRYFDAVTMSWELMDPADDAEWEAGKGCLFQQNVNSGSSSSSGGGGDGYWYIYDNAGVDIITQDQWLLLGCDFTDPENKMLLMVGIKNFHWMPTRDVSGIPTSITGANLIVNGIIPERERNLPLAMGDYLGLAYVQPTSPRTLRVGLAPSNVVPFGLTNVKVRIRQAT